MNDYCHPAKPAVVPVMIRRQPLTLGLKSRLALAGLCLLGVTGCVSYPISKQFREQAQTTKDVSFLTIWANPDAYQGRMVIWGGKILKTVNETNGDFVTVLQAPLDAHERPGSTKHSPGRFIVRSAGLLGPEVYRTGAKITVAGELSGTETQKVGNRNYACPVIRLRDVYFWRPESAGSGTSVYYGVSPVWGWGGYDSFGPYDDGFDGFQGYYDSDLDRDWGRGEYGR